MSENEPRGFGRPQDPPIDADYIEHLRSQAVSASDGVWVNPDVLEHLVAVFEAACDWMDAANAIESGRRNADLVDAIERARGNR